MVSEQLQNCLAQRNDASVYHAGNDSLSEVEYADLFKYERDDSFAFPACRGVSQTSEACPERTEHLALYSKILEGCRHLNHPSKSGDVVRAVMFVLDRLASSRPPNHIHNEYPKEDHTNLYVQMIDAINSAVPNPHEKASLLSSIFVQYLLAQNSFQKRTVIIPSFQKRTVTIPLSCRSRMWI